MQTPINILLLEDDDSFSSALTQIMTQKGHQVHWVNNLPEFRTTLNEKRHFDLILMDLKLGNDTSLDAISDARKKQPTAKIFMITAYASIATTVQAIKYGADDYLPKPFTTQDIFNAYEGLEPNNTHQARSPKRVEWEYIQKVLVENNGNISRTAKILGMHRRTLQRKLNKKPND